MRFEHLWKADLDLKEISFDKFYKWQDPFFFVVEKNYSETSQRTFSDKLQDLDSFSNDLPSGQAWYVVQPDLHSIYPLQVIGVE